MKGRKNSCNTLGTLSMQEDVCLTLTDANGTALLETYAYEVGFFRFNWHPSLEIMMVLQGSLTAYTERGAYELSENDFLVINSNEGHASLLQEQNTVAAVLHISQSFLEQLCDNANVPMFYCCSADEKETEACTSIRSGFAAIYCALVKRGLTERLLVQAQIRMILSLLLKYFSGGEPSPKELRFSNRKKHHIHAIIRYIDRHFRDKVTLAELIDVTGMNASYLSSYFKMHTGIGFHEYLTRKRLNYAAYMLNNTTDSILEIALDAGFPDAKALNQAFRKYFGINPGSYRDGLNDKTDNNVKSIEPVRLGFSHPLIQEKMNQYLKEPIPLLDFVAR